MSGEPLADLDKAYPESGTYRTVQVYRCRVCKSLTNNAEIVNSKGRYAIKRVYPICPHREQEWHKLLRSKLRLASPAHPASYRKEMEAEIAQLLLNSADDTTGPVDLGTERPFPTYRLVIEDGPYFSAL